MEDEIYIEESSSPGIENLTDFLDQAVIIKIINKLTDFAEILSEGKLAQIINFNFDMNRTQSNNIIDLLINIGAISRIKLIAQKGTKDLEDEFISNIFSDTNTPENISSYISIRNILENRLTHQTQQYNMNMGKSNTTQAMSINELRGNVKTFIELSSNDVPLSTKSQHGFIAASLHDAYVTLINRTDWWNDRTYMKFFFNEDDNEKKNLLLVSRKIRESIIEISGNIQRLLDEFGRFTLEQQEKSRDIDIDSGLKKVPVNTMVDPQSKMFNDRLMLTPFGKQYGLKIDSIITHIFSSDMQDLAQSKNETEIKDQLHRLYDTFISAPAAIKSAANDPSITMACSYLIFSEFGLKGLAENFLFERGKESFSKFYSEEKKSSIEEFATIIFSRYFEIEFESLFRIIKSQDMKKFACAFIIKRLYLTLGEDLSTFGFFLIKAIARTGKIKTI